MPVKYNDRVFFYIHPKTSDPNKGYIMHLLICLAEGLREIGVEFYSNVNYWYELPDKEEYLFRHDPKITPDDCSIVVLQTDVYRAEKILPQNLFHPKRKYITAYLDCEDGDKTYLEAPEFKTFDFVFRCHYNSKLKYGSNLYPWCFGLSNRILRELEEIPNFLEKKRQLLINFRHWKKGHAVRNISCKELIPKLEKILEINNYIEKDAPPIEDPYHYLHWLQTGQRHYPSYYDRLKKSAACAAFGGFFVPPYPKNPGNLINRVVKQILIKLNLKTNRVVQWDSWRFWESLAAGCATFHVDFDKYGIALPVMPENWQHYIGIDLDNVQEAVDRIANDPEIIERIATQGRLWALEHYSPTPTALRFLETIHKNKRIDDLKQEEYSTVGK